MSSARAEVLAELLWELKKADKLATYTAMASRAGFKPGANGRTFQTCIGIVRREWPHLQWWRAVSDDLHVEQDSEQAVSLSNNGFSLQPSETKKGQQQLTEVDERLMTWQPATV